MVRIFAFAALCLAVPAFATATPLDIVSSGVAGSDNNPYAFVGADYQTTGVDLSTSGSTATLSFTTLFSGSETVGGYAIHYADIFLDNGLAISLGEQTANGGLAQAGLYQTTSYLTSQQVWGGRSGVIYGAGYRLGGTQMASPTVLTGGSLIEGITISDTLLTNGVYDLAISFAQNPALGSATGLFWGTGDCGNGGIYAEAAPQGGGTPVPEPAAIGMFGVALLGLAVVQARQGKLFFFERGTQKTVSP